MYVKFVVQTFGEKSDTTGRKLLRGARHLADMTHSGLEGLLQRHDVLSRGLSEDLKHVCRFFAQLSLSNVVDAKLIEKEQLVFRHAVVMRVLAQDTHGAVAEGWSFRSLSDRFDYMRGLLIAANAAAFSLETGRTGKNFLESGDLHNELLAWKLSGLWKRGQAVYLQYEKVLERVAETIDDGGILPNVFHGTPITGKPGHHVPNTGLKSVCEKKYATQDKLFQQIEERIGRDAFTPQLREILDQLVVIEPDGRPLPPAESGFPKYRSMLIGNPTTTDKNLLKASNRLWNASINRVVVADGRELEQIDYDACMQFNLQETKLKKPVLSAEERIEQLEAMVTKLLQNQQ